MKKILYSIYKALYTLLVAISLGLAKSFGYKIANKEAGNEKRIEGEK